MEHTVQQAGSRKGKGGPKTAEGKARSALNAVTHGLTARAPVALWFETEEAWTTFRTGIIASLAPVGEAERDLVEKIALTLWRQNRVAAYETHRTNLALSAAPGEVERSLRPDHTDADAQARFLAKLTERLLLGDLELLKLQRYESHLGRELSRLFKHLHQLQDRRRAEHRETTPGGTPAHPPTAAHEQPIGAPQLASATPAATASTAPKAPFAPIHEALQPSTPSRMATNSFLQNELTQSALDVTRPPFKPTLSATVNSAPRPFRPRSRSFASLQADETRNAYLNTC